MSEIDKLVENYFKPQNSKFSIETLFQLIEQVAKNPSVSSATDTKNLPIPRFNLSEKWGQPGSSDRKIIDMFFKKIAPEQDLQSKIAQIERFLTECDERCVSEQNIGEILANLVFLDTLSSIVFDYNASVAGYLFEAFLSALLLGRQEVAAGNKTIEDILDKDDVPLSLKLIKVGADLKGSRKLLQNTFDKWGSIKYIVGSKQSTKELHIIFYEITITPENIDEMGGWDHNRFSIKPYDYERTKIGAVNLGTREQIRAVGQRYADRLGDSLFMIYELLENLSNNINQYFLREKPEDKSAGLLAHSDAIELQNKIKTLID